jgi:hypothetical protein
LLYTYVLIEKRSQNLTNSGALLEAMESQTALETYQVLQTAVPVRANDVVPATPSDRIAEIERIRWLVIRELEDRLRAGGDEERWQAVNQLKFYLDADIRSLQVLKSILQESEDFRESRLWMQALKDVLATESPAFRKKFLDRLRELKAQVARETEAPKRQRGRPVAATGRLTVST